MSNKHVEYKRIVAGADKAVLCIHGILGTPNHFRDLIPLIPENYSVFAMVTAGHCSTVSDFNHSSLQAWEDSVQKAIDELLKTHKEVYILAHSMGNLLAIEQAIKEPRIKGLFCISIPIKVGVRTRIIGIAARVYRKKYKHKEFPEDRHEVYKDKDLMAPICSECYGITDTKNIFKYLGWVPRFIDLFKLIKRVRKNLNKLNTPCVAYQSIPDELVSPKSIKILKNESKIKVVALEDSTHFYYDEKDMELLSADFKAFLNT